MRAPEEPRRLVVDCDVATGAGLNENPRSQRCLAVLEAIRKAKHHIHLSPQLYDEWLRHLSPSAGKGASYALGWMVEMIRTEFLHQLPEQPDSGIAAAIAQADLAPKTRQDMLKDAHLPETALLYDHIIISCDERAYRLFHDATELLPQIQALMWLNPERPDDDCAAWCAAGAQPVEARCIGKRPRKAPK
jgi:predicted nucleic acid-binding protein